MTIDKQISDEVWPEFLDRLDADKAQAAERFSAFADAILRKSPPREMRSLPLPERDDLIQAIITSCLENDFAKLRSYQNRGRPFAAWFYFVCRNAILNHLGKSTEVASGVDDEGLSAHSLAPEKNPESAIEQRDLLERVNGLIEKLDRMCQLLLRLAAEEFKPSEMAVALGMPVKTAKKLSDDLRYCRKKLTGLLAGAGIDLRELGL